MGFPSVLSLVHQWVGERVQPGDAAVDATMGGGNDTLVLARLVGERGKVFAFDVQEEALRRTRERLERELGAVPQVELLQGGHEQMERRIPPAYHGRLAAVMFNLGYLPGSADLTVITRPATTLPALRSGLRLLRRGGLLAAVLYPGHPGGREEAEQVEEWAASLPKAEAQVLCCRFPQQPDSPYVIGIEKRL